MIIGGRSGTLGELAISYDEGKLIGVLTGTGGISDLVADILAACAKDRGARVIYDSDPERLVEALLTAYRIEHFRRPSCFCSDRTGESIPGASRDPVCGMALTPTAAAAERLIGDQRLLFCWLACVQRFAAEPERFHAIRHGSKQEGSGMTGRRNSGDAT